MFFEAAHFLLGSRNVFVWSVVKSTSFASAEPTVHDVHRADVKGHVSPRKRLLLAASRAILTLRLFRSDRLATPVESPFEFEWIDGETFRFCIRPQRR